MVGRLQTVLNWVGFVCLVYMIMFTMIYGVGMEVFGIDIPRPNNFFIDLFFIKLVLYPICLVAQYIICGKGHDSPLEIRLGCPRLFHFRLNFKALGVD